MPSDSPAPGVPAAPAAKVDFTSVMANVKAIAAKHGIAASMAAPATSYSAQPPKREFEEDSYSGHQEDDGSYGKRMAYGGML
jgi:membrane-bound lytic murein transglycosylase B